MNYENITLEVHDGVARLTLNRPDRLNSFTDAMHAELRVALDAIQNREGDAAGARVLVLTGAGRGFCAGQDLGDRAMQIATGKLPDIGNVVERNYKPLALRLQNLRVPTISAVNGVAAGAGCSVALRLRPGRRGEVGLLPPGVQQDRPDPRHRRHLVPAAARRHGARDGPRPARRQAAGGEGGRVGPDLAVRRGCRIRGDHRRPRRAARQAPTKALVRTRQAMHAAPGHTLEQQLSFEGGFMRELGWSPDYAEGVAAFTAKRPPNFTGD